MNRLMIASALLLTMTGLDQVSARPMPGPTVTFGPNCHAISRVSRQDTLYVGTVLGGQIRPGKWGDGTFRDYRTFQGCFRSVDACQIWISGHASRHTSPPGYARCTEVFVGLNPARR